MNATRLFTIAFALVLLAGCGNKGPLVLRTPPIDPATVPEEAPAEAAPAETMPADTAPAEPATEPVENNATPPETTPPEMPAPTDGDGNG